MTISSAVAPQLNYVIEAAVAGIVMTGFIVTSMAMIRERHRDMGAWHVHFGAAIYGAVFGLVIGFVVVPLRFMLIEGDLPPQTAGYSGLAMLLLVIALRRGLIGRLPFLGPQVKAFRRASLRRQIENAQKQLGKLTPDSEKANQSSS